ncbi:MAG: hypothetical protein ACLFQ6_04060 [Candidatus Sumerlaeia bacterium]
MKIVATIAKVILVLLCVGLIVYGAFWYGREEAPDFPIERLAESEAHGTPPRVEREFKFGMDISKARKSEKSSAGDSGTEAVSLAELPDQAFFMTDAGLAELQEYVYRALQNRIADPAWQAPGVLDNPYYIARDPMTFVARDVYADTQNNDFERLAISYRLRHRFRSLNQMDNHEKRPTQGHHFPYRCEIQSKTEREELGDGWSRVSEARFEFRVESAPFSPQNPPPPPPWHVKDYFPVMQKGVWQDMVILPGKELAAFLKEKKVEGPVTIVPRIMLVTSRMRMHLDIKSPYGSGPNPEQAFIISIDRSDVFDGEAYLDYLRANWYERSVRPPVQATFFEVEIEFERNVSTVLDRLVAEKGTPELRRTLKAFHHDLQMIRDIAIEALEARGVQCDPRGRNKYLQSLLEIE